MRAKLNRMWMTRQAKYTRLLAVGIMVAPLFAASAWAETYNLDGVDFVANGNRTDVILHTGSIVPVQKIHTSKSKLILDIDQINAEETIRTNFSGANISHVILKPLGHDKIRLIVRGEDLGVPSIAYRGGNSGYTRAEKQDIDSQLTQLEKETATALHAIQEEGMQPANLTAENPVAGEQPAVDTDVVPDEAPLTMDDADVSGVADIQPAPTGMPDDTAPLPLASGQTTAGGMETDFFKQLTEGNFGKYLPAGILGLLILGLGLFARHKFIQLTRREPHLEELLEEQAQGRRVGFREMANAYRSKHHDRIGAEKAVRAEKTSAARPGARKSEDMIGLRGLKRQVTESVTPEPGSPPENALEKILSAMQESQPKMPKAPAPKKQAINQYLRNENKPKNRPGVQPFRPEEIQRAQGVRQQVEQDLVKRAAKPGISSPANPVNRAPAARKNAPVSTPAMAKMNQRVPAQPTASGGQQGPLPNNPEVLNFLRNVADLMEKDGKTDIARNIHKNLNGRSLGTI